jgi:hypothetical protein
MARGRSAPAISLTKQKPYSPEGRTTKTEGTGQKNVQPNFRSGGNEDPLTDHAFKVSA